ncbi:MAG: methyltransferase [Gammaproteobacteria bacterium]|nr:methyltransferase [Gammaproteobacteria bacterium]MDX5374710.1 methyltransferase [Gammaproteobacteria bacterium]
MPVFGTPIFETHDDEGPIRVLADGNRRVLAFGEATEQSSQWVDDPARLLFPYTQAMMLGLLFVPANARALLLGLGAGSMVHALLAHREALQVEAVERRAAVITVAREWFALPEDDRLTLHVADALDHLARRGQPVDLIFTDLFHEGGMDTQQSDAVFLQRCHDTLAPGGVLVINRWDTTYEETRDHQRELERQFDGNVLTLSVPGGNQVALCFRDDLPRLDPRSLLADAASLGKVMRIPLRDYANRLLHNNRARLSRPRPAG